MDVGISATHEVDRIRAATIRSGPTGLFLAGVFVGVVVCGFITGDSGVEEVGAASPDAREAIAELRTELEHFKALVPDQAHAMQDVAYHFSALWFAGDHKNWPLAEFYLAETRSHLNWAVRIRPTRATKAGDVDLAGILESVDGTLLAAVQEAIVAKDSDRFTQAYRQTIEGCYACHKASEKPFIRPQVPKTPTVHILNLDPAADWPQ